MSTLFKPKSTKLKKSKLDVEAALENFYKFGDLPPMLSPTLPAWAKNKSPKRHSTNFRGEFDVNNGKEDSDIPKLILSPTLPSVFDEPYEKKDKVNGHTIHIKQGRSSRSVNVCLFIKPRELRKLRDKKLGQPASIVRKRKATLDEKRRNVESFYSDSDSDEPKKRKEPINEVSKSIREKETREREVREAKEREAKEREAKAKEAKEREVKERELKEREIKEREAKERESREKEAKEIKEREIREREIREKELRSSRTTPTSIPMKPVVRATPSRGKVDSPIVTRLKSILNSKKKRYVEKAKAKKHEADRIFKETRNLNLFIITTLDSLLLFMIAFIYDDRARNIDKVGPSERQWSTLIPFISHLFSSEKYSVSGSMLLIEGLYYQLRASISHYLRHISSVRTHQYVERKRELETMKRNSDPAFIKDDEAELKEINGKLLNQYYPKSSKYADELEKDFLKGEKLLSFYRLESSFPKTFEKYKRLRQGFESSNHSSMISYMDEQNNLLLNEIKEAASAHSNRGKVDYLLESLEKNSLANGAFYLPFAPYVQPTQVVAYGYSVLKEWCEENDVNYEWSF